MFSKEEVQRIKREFWITFADVHPRKWILYNTKIKDVAFKFYIDNKPNRMNANSKTLKATYH